MIYGGFREDSSDKTLDSVLKELNLELNNEDRISLFRRAEVILYSEEECRKFGVNYGKPSKDDLSVVYKLLLQP